MVNKLVSIIIPLYNAEDYLKTMLDSLIKQTYKNIEIILIDDGSKDNSLIICNEYASQYNNFKVYHKKNEGVSSARNLGIKFAQGEFITFCDADDYVKDNLIESLIEDITNKRSDLSIGSIAWDINGHYKYMIFKNDNLQRNIYKELFNKHNLAKYGGPCAKLFKTSIIKENNLVFNKNIRFCEDIIFLFNYLLYTQSVSTIDNCLYYYVEHPNSYSKRIYSYFNEWNGYINFYNVIDIMKKSFLDTKSYNNLKYTTVFIDRVIKSIYKEKSSRKERINRLKLINWHIYKKCAKTYSWKEWIMKQILSYKLFYIYDYVMINFIKNK